MVTCLFLALPSGFCSVPNYWKTSRLTEGWQSEKYTYGSPCLRKGLIFFCRHYQQTKWCWNMFTVIWETAFPSVNVIWNPGDRDAVAILCSLLCPQTFHTRQASYFEFFNVQAQWINSKYENKGYVWPMLLALFQYSYYALGFQKRGCLCRII